MHILYTITRIPLINRPNRAVQIGENHGPIWSTQFTQIKDTGEYSQLLSTSEKKPKLVTWLIAGFIIIQEPAEIIQVSQLLPNDLEQK